MRCDQARVRDLLTDTVTLLCKSGLNFDQDLRIEGVLGITVDGKDVFLVHLNEFVQSNSIPARLSSESDDPSELTQYSDDSISNSELVDYRGSYFSDVESNQNIRGISSRKNGIQKEKFLPSSINSYSDSVNNLPVNTIASPAVFKSFDNEIFTNYSDKIKDDYQAPGDRLQHRTSSDNDTETKESVRDCLEGYEGYGSKVIEFPQEQNFIAQNQNNSPRIRRSRRSRLPSLNNSHIMSSIARKSFPEIVKREFLSEGAEDEDAQIINADIKTRLKSSPSGLDLSSNNCNAQLDYWDDITQQTINQIGYSEWMLGGDGHSSHYDIGDVIRQKNFVCTEDGCSRRFYRCSELYRHQRIKHGASFRQPKLSCKRRKRRFVE